MQPPGTSTAALGYMLNDNSSRKSSHADAYTTRMWQKTRMTADGPGHAAKSCTWKQTKQLRAVSNRTRK